VALDRFEFDRTLAAFDDTTPVGATMCYSFQLSVPGQEVLPAAGGDVRGGHAHVPAARAC
jgi:hypothetical protein